MHIILFTDSIPTEIFEGVQQVHQAVFSGDLLKQEKLNRKKLIALVAIIEEQVVGFKFGYEHPDGAFYSWLGGVHPSFQRQGIAQKLIEDQHQFVKEKGYTLIRTYSRNEKMAMLLLNLRNGFLVHSTFIDEKGIHKIVLEKNI